ncbi:hypothetical protein NA57DRAFT_26372, partial [Rhizodiscina lignyota]
MTKKKRRHPDVEDVLARPWCYYCERDFDDLKILISHQKAKHFKCDRCGRRLNTAGGLAVHMNQVHKETLEHVENAVDGRSSLEHEIFGMEGVPDPIKLQHEQSVLKRFYEQQAERHKATGNPPPGENGDNAPKRPKLEDPSSLKQRLAEFKARKAAGAPPPQYVAGSPPLPFHNHQQRQPSIPNVAGLPQRPNFGGQPGNGYPPHYGQQPPPDGNATSVDDLISSVANQTQAGTSNGTHAATDAQTDKKSKKDKNTRLVYSDNEVSPEEKMATLSKY